MLQVFVAGDDAAFEVDFDAIISDDDLFHQLLHDHAVICVHDCAALDVFSEAVQPHLDLAVSVLCGLQFCLLGFQRLHPFTVFFDLHRLIRCCDAALLLGLMQFQHRILQVDDLQLDAIQRCSVFRLHDQPRAFLNRCHDFLCILDHVSDSGRVGVLQRIFVHMVTVAHGSAVYDAVCTAPKAAKTGITERKGIKIAPEHLKNGAPARNFDVFSSILARFGTLYRRNA